VKKGKVEAKLSTHLFEYSIYNNLDLFIKIFRILNYRVSIGVFLGNKVDFKVILKRLDAVMASNLFVVIIM
jgi:hypothetical protein